MDRQRRLCDFVLEKLRQKSIAQRQIAAASGVPYSTVCKIAQGRSANPRVNTVQKLADYFHSAEASEPESGMKSTQKDDAGNERNVRRLPGE